MGKKANTVGPSPSMVPSEKPTKTPPSSNPLKTPDVELFKKIELDRQRSMTPKPPLESDVVVEDLENKETTEPLPLLTEPLPPPTAVVRRLKTPEAKREDIEKVTDCPFKEFGCEKSDSAHEIKKHIRDNR
ncbi:hypothetical protein L596_007306 [Steinernema carpocapsae]|uniref:Uncharacterized protein n=1 Tax=Steinernema carpocapsae TaxID=34508 RepID=A0A4V6A5Y9_STECR|nr:hypothetical protein L596_007306 [Steinernema carpocapsae]